MKIAGKIGDVVAWLKSSAFGASFLRVKHELDKEAMLKDRPSAITVPGVSIVTDEEDFFVLPAGLSLAEETP